MAKQASTLVEKPSLVQRLKTFMEEVKAELAKVSWPTPEDIKGSTQIVLILLVAVAVVVYVYDMVFRVLVLGLLSLLV